MVGWIANVAHYHTSLVKELISMYVKMHQLLAHPESLIDELANVEREYRETVDIRKQYTRT